MSVPPRGARNRRSGRRPGWPLLTALLVLAILASSTIVFSSKVELLRLAVILSLWAAVLAAFVSVVYRRQSELDQARARDMKYVYDLQLDREIAARREYELGVEAHLRRQLTRELRTEAGEEMAALRAELVSLRSHLEALLGTDLGERPALQSDRVAMAPPPQLGRVESSRVTAVIREEILEVTEETITEVTVTEEMVAEEVVVPEEPTAVAEVPFVAEPVIDEPVAAEPVAEIPVVDEPVVEVPATSPEPVTAPVTPPPVAPPVPPPPPAAWQQPDYRGSHRRPPEAPAEPAMAPAAAPPPRPPVPPQQPVAPWRPPETQPRRGRHWVAEDARESEPAQPAEPVLAAQSDALRGRHRDEEAEAAAQPVEDDGQHTGGQSVADLMARLQVNAPTGGGGRRRRED